MEFAGKRSNEHFGQTGDRLIGYVWPMAVILMSVYMIVFYVLPVMGIFVPPSYPLKLAVEFVLCCIPVLVVIVGVGIRITSEKVHFKPSDDLVLLSMGDYHFGTYCLQMESTSVSALSDSEGKAIYDPSILLAIRSGLEDGIRITFEAGIEKSQPVLRLFITVVGRCVDSVKRTLRREATRCEAIIMSSAHLVELRQLKGKELERAVTRNELTGEGNWTSSLGDSILLLRGKPRCSPRPDTSQIGRFMSTLLKQGADAILVCTLSAAKPGKEKRKLESKWQKIRTKEKRKEDSLADQAEKHDLLGHYRTIRSNMGWYDSTVYIQVSKRASGDSQGTMDSLGGIVASLWGNGDEFELKSHEIDRPTLYRMISRGHIKKQRFHTNDLVAYVNLPIQKLPVISKAYTPTFEIPSRERIDHELQLGWATYAGRKLGMVGLKKEWLMEHMAVLGATGTGKTTLVKQLMIQLSENTDVPWWIFDVKGSEYTDLVNLEGADVLVLRPGLDPSFVIELIDSELDSKETAYTTFLILRELLREKGVSSDLSPAMEKLLREAVFETVGANDQEDSVSVLMKRIGELAGNDRSSLMTRDALLNRLEIISREPLRSVFGGKGKRIRISDLLDKRVVFDLRYVARVGGMDAARLLYNLVAKRIFEGAMKRGLSPDLEHVVVLEEASNLVPESYTRNTAADVTTGESMVLLQRATGQGVIVISTRPTISSNILANTRTKVVFRLPYDSAIGARFLSLDEDQERYLRSLEVGRALISIPDCRTFEITAMEPTTPLDRREEVHEESPTPVHDESAIDDDSSSIRKALKVDISEMTSHVVAFLASERIVVFDDLLTLLRKVMPGFSEDDATDFIQSLVSRSAIERESISLVPGGFIFALPGKGLDSIRSVIVNYIISRLNASRDLCVEDVGTYGGRILFDEAAVLIFAQHLKASSIDGVLETIRHQMASLGNNVQVLHVVVRGSLAAARLREFISDLDGFESVNVVSAFPSSLDGLVEDLESPLGNSAEAREIKSVTDFESEGKEERVEDSTDLRSTSTDSVQKRIWLGLIQDFVELRNGQVSWNDVMNFIETTSLQSPQSRSVPLPKELGKRALTELLADEMLTAIRNDTNERWIEIEKGLWIVNTSVLEKFRTEALEFLKGHLSKSNRVYVGHEFYDLCSGDTSYVIFPTQQQLTTLQRMHGNIACRKCESTRVVCILSAAEYMDESVVNPENLELVTLDTKLKAILT
ncbi:ATP-binding protein [Candidatus Thorarchaeota archaeon]|nr:MAG: ATP-binding protein [Candidatus Thorarchaeota archaeon]